jgi:HK97 family phage major capsid protein
MLQSVTIQRRQSAIRSELAALSAKEQPSADEVRALETLDGEYGVNEKRLRAALISEDTERRDAKDHLETRGDREYSDLIGKFELRQIALHLDEGRNIDGATAEIVQEMRNTGSYRGIPVPFAALERRSGETIASGVPDPILVKPIIDRIFPSACAVRMGAQIVNVDNGGISFPVVTSSVAAGWTSSETGVVAGPTAYATTGRALNPVQTLGVTMRLTRQSLKQAPAELEQAVRRDMANAIAQKLDNAVFLGAGSGGVPQGIFTNSSYSINSTSVGAATTWDVLRAAVTLFLEANAANGPGDVRLLMRPELYNKLDGELFTNTAVSHWDKAVANLGHCIVVQLRCGPDWRHARIVCTDDRHQERHQPDLCWSLGWCRRHPRSVHQRDRGNAEHHRTRHR